MAPRSTPAWLPFLRHERSAALLHGGAAPRAAGGAHGRFRSAKPTRTQLNFYDVPDVLSRIDVTKALYDELREVWRMDGKPAN